MEIRRESGKIPVLAQIGSIISGTTQAEYLIPAFSGALRNLAGKNATALALCNKADKLEDYESSEAEIIFDELFMELDAYAPPYCYFGARIDNLADYGFWVYPWDDLRDMVIDDGGVVIAPPYCYFGARIDNLADYGFWVYPWDDLRDMVVDSDLSEFMVGHYGNVLLVSERGNYTLLYSENGELTKIWAIV